jgi:hypothetical protein
MAATNTVDAVHNSHKEMSTYQETGRAKSAPVGVDWLLIWAARSLPDSKEVSSGKSRWIGVENWKRSVIHNP